MRIRANTIRGRLVISFALAIAVVAVVGAAGWTATVLTAHGLNSLYDQNLMATVRLAKGQGALWQLRYGVPQYLATDEAGRQKIVADQPKLYQIIEECLSDYERSELSPEERQAVATLRQAYTHYKEVRPHWIELQYSGKTDEAVRYRSEVTTPAGTATAAAFSDVIALQQVSAERTRRAAADRAAWLGTGVGLLLLISIAIFIVVGYYTDHSITDPIREFNAAVKEMATSGHLDQEVRVEREDEIGELAQSFTAMIAYLKQMAGISKAIAGGDLTIEVEPRSDRDTLGLAFGQMVEGLREIVSSVRDTATQVASGSAQVADASQNSAKISVQSSASIDEVASTMHQMSVNVDNMAKNTQMQSSSVEETSSSIHQMVASIARVAESAKALIELSKHSRAEAEAGIATMENATQGLSRIHHSIVASSTVIASLGERAHNIGKIVEVIDDISEQSNLLALNAAIEAARAGEHGLGFAVVAEEVRKLADRSAQSTTEISNLIKSIQKEAVKAVEDMERNTVIVQDGLAMGNDLSQALNKISNVVGDVCRLAEQIGSATDEQADGSAQIANTTNRLNGITEEIKSAANEQAVGATGVVKAMAGMREMVAAQTSGSAELAAAAGQMSHMARTMMECMDRFTVEGHAARSLAGKSKLTLIPSADRASAAARA